MDVLEIKGGGERHGATEVVEVGEIGGLVASRNDRTEKMGEKGGKREKRRKKREAGEDGDWVGNEDGEYKVVEHELPQQPDQKVPRILFRGTFVKSRKPQKRHK